MIRLIQFLHTFNGIGTKLLSFIQLILMGIRIDFANY